jgi:oxygen-independent coproporphyrinogen-3 oxidase
MNVLQGNTPPPGGIYVHIPFCVRKCHYCDFYSTTELALIDDFIIALEREIQMAAPVDLEFDSLYFGGGTPSVLMPAQIRHVMRAIFRNFTFLPDPEVNLEVNPGSVDRSKLVAYRAEGINRLTIGAQSFNERQLRFLRRIHSATEARQTIEWAGAAGFEHLGLDLIYGLPGQTRDDWIEDLRTAVSFQPEHLSCYLLTIEPGTPLHTDVRCGRVKPVDEKRGAELFRATVEFLAGCGYHQYEVSNFAYSDPAGVSINRSRHNQKYWTFAPYIGFGPGAHSYLKPKRFWNHRNLQTYLTDIRFGNRPMAGSEALTRSQMIMEAILLGLRQSDGIDLAAFKNQFGLDFEQDFPGLIKELLTEGKARVGENRLSLTLEGMLLLDSICERFVEGLEE